MTTQTDAYDRLINILKELFQLDQADLDFGIYRIMNQKRDDVTDFLENRLVAQVEETLHDAGVDPETSEKYLNLKGQLLHADTTDLQHKTFSHLTNFFKRYYSEGDFISQRRYKDDVYAIPYQGEEVKLHWANHDQYYIKTSEYFKNYRFKLRNKKWINFELTEASTEQNNNKSQNGERRFKLAEDTIYSEDGNTLTIYFTYEPMSKKKKQDKLMAQAFDTLKEELPTTWLTELLQPKPTKKDKDRTLLEKHLKDYTARNTFDYFIHKDLGKFLRRELDFYIKNEILHIDDIDLDREQSYNESLQIIKAFKKVGLKIIEFLAQLEDFQKKLWLKKKFVLQSDYCITLDRIDEQFYEDIAANEQQREEWIQLYAIDELDDYAEPLTVEFLKEHPFLMIDTQFYPREWKYKLLASIDHLDEQTDGLMINSENFQALNFLKNKFSKKIDVTYLDPPYNTASSEILYKNNYKHSSWASLINDRIELGDFLNSPDGFFNITIDYAEFFNLGKITDQLYGEDNRVGILTIYINPKGRQHERFFSSAVEYMLVYAKSLNNSKFNDVTIDEEKAKQFNRKDEKGKYRLDEFARIRTSTKREKKPNFWYPIYVSKDLEHITHKKKENYFEIYPIKDSGEEYSWKLIKDSFKEKNQNDLFVAERDNNGNVKIYNKYYEKQVFKNIWTNKKYFPEFQGTNLLKDILGKSLFSYPKSIYAVHDTLKIMSKKNSIILDYFAGSGTTGHAVINLNRERSGSRKYIMVEMGQYFNSVTKPRIQKVVYSKDWKDGKPVDREGISHMFKFMRLESYEDTLNNLELARTDQQEELLENEALSEEYILQYMLEVESRDSLLRTEIFKKPFGYTIEATEHNERYEQDVDLVETFNYLLGLHVESLQLIRRYVVVIGNTNDGQRILVIWRDLDEHSNEDLEEFFDTMAFNTLDTEFDFIYVNGDNNLQNKAKEEETWKVRLIEEEFHKRMFEEKGL